MGSFFFFSNLIANNGLRGSPLYCRKDGCLKEAHHICFCLCSRSGTPLLDSENRQYHGVATMDENNVIVNQALENLRFFSLMIISLHACLVAIRHNSFLVLFVSFSLILQSSVENHSNNYTASIVGYRNSFDAIDACNVEIRITFVLYVRARTMCYGTNGRITYSVAVYLVSRAWKLSIPLDHPSILRVATAPTQTITTQIAVAVLLR